MPYYNTIIGGLNPETFKSVVWLALCGLCVIFTVSLIVLTHLTVIKRYNELTNPTSETTTNETTTTENK